MTPTPVDPTATVSAFMSLWPGSVHELKTVQPYFDAVVSEAKTFEIRRADRDFKIGDLLVLWEWDGEAYSGMWALRVITYVMQDGRQFAVDPAFVVLGIRPLADGDLS